MPLKKDLCTIIPTCTIHCVSPFGMTASFSPCPWVWRFVTGINTSAFRCGQMWMTFGSYFPGTDLTRSIPQTCWKLSQKSLYIWPTVQYSFYHDIIYSSVEIKIASYYLLIFFFFFTNILIVFNCWWFVLHKTFGYCLTTFFIFSSLSLMAGIPVEAHQYTQNKSVFSWL